MELELLKTFQGLGSNEQSVRDKNLIKLKTVLRNLPKIQNDKLPERLTLFRRVWTCVFYYFWNTDKQVVQQKSAKLISTLLDSTLNIEYFFSTCLEEINKKWSKIDFLRLDKYIMLMDCLYCKFFSSKRVLNKPSRITKLIVNFKKLAVGISSKSFNIELLSNPSYSVTQLSQASFNFNHSFFRNFIKNIGKYLHVVSLCEKALYSVLTFVKILNTKEVSLFEEFILDKIFLLSKSSWDTEQKSQTEYSTIEEVPQKIHSSRSHLKNTLTELLEYESIPFLLKESIQIVISRLSKRKSSTTSNASQGSKNSQSRKGSINEENPDSLFSLKKSSTPQYKIDPVNDYTLDKKYLTKFRMSHMQKLKILSERKKKMKALGKKISAIPTKPEDIEFTEEKIVIDKKKASKEASVLKKETVNPYSQKRFDEEDSDMEIHSDSLEDFMEEDTQESVPKNKDKETKATAKKFNSEGTTSHKSHDKNILVVPDKHKLLSNAANKYIGKEESDKNSSVSDKPSKPNKSNIIDSDLDICSSEDENQSSNKNYTNKVNQVTSKKPIKLNKVNMDIDSSSDSEDQEKEHEAEEDSDQEISNNDKYLPLNEDSQQINKKEGQLEWVNDNEEDFNYDDSYDEEELEEIDDEDDLDFLNDMNFDQKGGMKNMSIQEQMLLQHLMNPPDYKRELFKKDSSEKKGEIDYKSLKEAISNSNLNMRNLKNHDFNYSMLGKKTKKKGHLFNNILNNKENNHTGTKVKFQIARNTEIKFDKNRSVILDSKYGRKMDSVKNATPKKSCLKK
mmetsp:Transcript_18766/g.19439  ORF Transcript_18766/g.19439 Transcript_18766/m.19439 type:complete len:789 (+) Transcript_18766:18-2384(+)